MGYSEVDGVRGVYGVHRYAGYIGTTKLAVLTLAGRRGMVDARIGGYVVDASCTTTVDATLWWLRLKIEHSAW